MSYNFCHECSAPLQQLTKTEYECANGHKVWNNPRATVSVIVINTKGELLYCKRGIEPKKGALDFPGGFLEFNEQPEDAAKRELVEETGLTAQSLKLLASYTQPYLPEVCATDAVYLCTSWSGTPKPADDVAELEWGPASNILKANFAWQYPGLPEIIESTL